MDRVRKILAEHDINAGVEDISEYENYAPYFVCVTFNSDNGSPPLVLKGDKATWFDGAFILDKIDHKTFRMAQAVKEVLTQEEIDAIHEKGVTPWIGLL